MKCAYTAESLIDGQMVMDLLTVAGVPCLMFNENAVGGFGELPVTYPEVWVKRDRDLPKALRMIDEFENSSSPCRRHPLRHLRRIQPRHLRTLLALQHHPR